MMKRSKSRMLSSVPPMAVVLQRCAVPESLVTDESRKMNKVYMERFVFQDTSKHDAVFDGPCGSVSEEELNGELDSTSKRVQCGGQMQLFFADV